MKFNLSKIMRKAWKLYRQKKEKGISFAESLHRAWLSAKAEEINTRKIEVAKQIAVFQKKQIPGLVGRSWAMR